MRINNDRDSFFFFCLIENEIENVCFVIYKENVWFSWAGFYLFT